LTGYWLTRGHSRRPARGGAKSTFSVPGNISDLRDQIC
jgi:hypothetical protein